MRSWINTLRTPAEDLGSLAENEPPTPLQSSRSSYEERRWQIEVEDKIQNARDRTVIAKTKQYLEESRSV